MIFLTIAPTSDGCHGSICRRKTISSDPPYVKGLMIVLRSCDYDNNVKFIAGT